MKPDLARLSEPFPYDDLEWKPQTLTRDKKKALAVAYIKLPALIRRLNEVCGPGGWRNEFAAGPDGGVICGLSIRVTHEDGATEWVTKFDGAENTDVEAVKGGITDAQKRACRQWGMALYLYDLPQQWVPVDERGRFTEAPRVPSQFLPGGGMPVARRPNTAAVPPPASAAPDRPALTPAQKRAAQALTDAKLEKQAVADALGRYGAERISELTDADAEALAASLAP